MPDENAEIRFENCGSVIRDARVDADVSIRDLALRLDMDRGRLSKIENNSLPITVTLIEQIAEALKCPPDSLIVKCLEMRFPKMRSSKAGKLILKLFEN